MNILFFIFSIVLIYSALSVVLRRNSVVAVLHLVLAFISCAVLWLLLEAEFLAMVLILVYVGAVMVLFLFVIMMLEPKLVHLRQVLTRRAPLGIFLVACLAGLFLYSFGREIAEISSERMQPLQTTDYSNTYHLGWALFDQYIYPFELAGMVLLLAIVAAIYLNLRKRPDSRRQKPSEQIKVVSGQRLKMVKLSPALPAQDDADPSDDQANDAQRPPSTDSQ